MDDDDEEDADFDDGGGSDDDDDDDSELSGMSDADDEVRPLSKSSDRHFVKVFCNLAALLMVQPCWTSRPSWATHLWALGDHFNGSKSSEACQPPAAHCRPVVSTLSACASWGGNVYDVPVNASSRGR